MPNIVPYSNFHELNLDWILEKMKELQAEVDAFIGSAVPSNDPPEMDGMASVGSSVNYARGDHVHPSDTSRASVSALNDLDTREYNDYVTLNANINTVDAKIAFTSAAPAMDGVASPGSSAYQARADHVHPTDTSRASKSEFDTLKATVDNFAGSSTPWDAMPSMDGAGSPGIAGSYSRGDHSHPSDTSKLDTAGGTITGDLALDGHFQYKSVQTFAETNATGWLRCAQVPAVPGTELDITVSRRGTDLDSSGEVHEIDLLILRGTAVFRHELSASDTEYVTMIRYSDAGYIDIYVSNVIESKIGFTIKYKATTSLADAGNIKCRNTPDWVGNAPDGETMLDTFTFSANTETVTSMNAIGKQWLFYRRGNAVMMTSFSDVPNAVTGTSQSIGTLPVAFRPVAIVEFPMANAPAGVYIRIHTNGTITLYTPNGLDANDPCSISATWLTSK